MSTPSDCVVLKVAVRDLVAFSLRGGDLFQHQFGSITALEGIRGHQYVQKARPAEYQSEVTVRQVYLAQGFQLEIAGRIDGVFASRVPVIVEEIKTTRRPFQQISKVASQLHLAQCCMYAALYAREHHLEKVVLQLTYLNVDSHKTHSRKEVWSRSELDAFFEDVVERYLDWAATLHRWRQSRDQSIAQLKFPFDSFREGQRSFAIATYRAVRDGQRLYAQAPTGIGKTLGSLFPALKALGEGACGRLFFLTAKTNGAQMAEKALLQMRGQGLAVKSVRITAKDKICFDGPCNLEICPFAIGYYDRVRDALKDAFSRDHFDRQVCEELAKKWTVCPFELSLDLAHYADLVICDYNYAFDPGVYLRRFFAEPAQNALIIDEAHNLVDRSRDMYSAQLHKRELTEVRSQVKQELPKLGRAIASIIRVCNKLSKAMAEESQQVRVTQLAPEPLLPALQRFCHAFESWLTDQQPEVVPTPLRELYFQVRRFLRCADFFDDRFAVIFRREGSQLETKIQCLDASHLLARMLDLNKATVFLSATLTPFDYYGRLLAASASDPSLNLPSPFPAENLCLLVAPWISTRYRDRAGSLDALLAVIQVVIEARQGNYLVYFPSYRYLHSIYELLDNWPNHPQIQVQQPGMDDASRQRFLDRFQQDDCTLVGFAVMGGAFAEGIDLVGESLIGVVVVGVGLPMVCTERDLMMQYFASTGAPGFDFAYQFPGMNRVLQAAGRVIRSKQDRGVVCLIDQRFSLARYRRLFPDHWQAHFARNPADVQSELLSFWAPNKSVDSVK